MRDITKPIDDQLIADSDKMTNQANPSEQKGALEDAT
jgi:hypothetical protein